MSEPLNSTEPVDPNDAILRELDFAYTDDATRAAALREGKTDPAILDFLHNIARDGFESMPKIILRSVGPADPGVFGQTQGDQMSDFFTRRVARRLEAERRLIQSDDDQNPDNWLS